MNKYILYYKHMEMPPEHTTCVSRWANTEKEAIKLLTGKAAKIGETVTNKKGAQIKVVMVEQLNIDE
jgi:hypothetical protein|tara:strand:- start:23 stop:223 length:201 start_codon:yes stop_codon:yes gene_type:complete